MRREKKEKKKKKESKEKEKKQFLIRSRGIAYKSRVSITYSKVSNYHD